MCTSDNVLTNLLGCSAHIFGLREGLKESPCVLLKPSSWDVREAGGCVTRYQSICDWGAEGCLQNHHLEDDALRSSAANNTAECCSGKADFLMCCPTGTV